jgi:hypothetical protein
MPTKTMATVATAPEWLVAEMPAGYQTRFAEIQRLSAEMHAMDRMARLLWETGESLHEAVSETFAGLKFEIESLAAAPSVLAVKLSSKQRLLVHVAAADSAIEKKSPELAAIFRVVHEIAGADDRVVLVVNNDRLAPPKTRPTPVSTEAADLLSRLGVNILPATTLFALWSQSQQEAQRARVYLERLHGQDGGLAPQVT